MAKSMRTAGIVAGIAAAAGILFLLVYSWLLPRLSYRQLVFAVTEESAITSAEVRNAGKTVELTDRQSIAIASWLAEYRSENKGLSHSSVQTPEELWLHVGGGEGEDICLYVDQNEIIFPGILGNYSIEVEYNDIYTLVVDLLKG